MNFIYIYIYIYIYVIRKKNSKKRRREYLSNFTEINDCIIFHVGTSLNCQILHMHAPPISLCTYHLVSKKILTLTLCFTSFIQ